MPTDADDTLFPFSLPSIGKKKITAAFDAGQISSDGGVLLLAGADKRLATGCGFWSVLMAVRRRFVMQYEMGHGRPDDELFCAVPDDLAIERTSKIAARLAETETH